MTRYIPLLMALNIVGPAIATAQPVRVEVPVQVSVSNGKTAGEGRELMPGVRFHWCPAGNFLMGTPGATGYETAVDVTLTQGFWLCETELTQSQFQSVMKSEPWKGIARAQKGPDYPATHLRYSDAVTYCEKLTAQERAAGRLPVDWKYSLPTEAQWEYACRSGTGTAYSFGDDESELSNYAWFATNARDIGAKYAHAVGQKRSSNWGFKDMHGNVWEWCSDCYDRKLPGGQDPKGVSSNSDSVRVIRGGGWQDAASYSRSASRFWFEPDYRDGWVGVRVAAIPTKE